MIQEETILTPDGPEIVPIATYAPNPDQVFIIAPKSAEVISNEFYQVMFSQALQEANFIINCQANNSLRNDGWDYQRFPEKDLVLHICNKKR